MKADRGQAIVLVLVLLALGTLLITPALGHVDSGLRAQAVSERAVGRERGADSALEDALWQLVNSGFPGSIPSYEFEMGSDKYNVDASFPVLLGSIDYAGQAGVPPDMHHLMLEVQPTWVPPGNVTLTYIFRMEWQAQKVKKFGFTLPKGLDVSETSTYALLLPQASLRWNAYIDPTNDFGNHQLNPLSTSAPPPGAWMAMTGGYYNLFRETPPPQGYQLPYLYVRTNPDGSKALEWSRTMDLSGDGTFIQTVHATGTPEYGVHYVQPWFQGVNWNPPPKTAAFGVATYAILIEYGGATYRVVVTYDSATSSFKVVSYEKVT